MPTRTGGGPHDADTTLTAGPSLRDARAAVVLVHGRGGDARDMLALARGLGGWQVAYLAPQATAGTWYPYSFLAALEENEPGLSSGLSVIAALIERIAAAGLPRERTVVLGFSQGGCLALEFAARNAARYGGIVGLSAGLIGPDGTPRQYPGSLDGTPVFLGCSDADPHIPLERVRESARVLEELGGDVTERIYPAMGHTVNAHEVRFVRGLIASTVS